MKEQITYRYKSITNHLFINIIDNYQCVNNCLFCGRSLIASKLLKNNIYEEAAGCLFLAYSPTHWQVMESIKKNLSKTDTEISFTGLGEPLIYFDKVIKIIQRLKQEYSQKINITTCGIIDKNILHPVKQLEEAGLDSIHISLNATTMEEYNQICQPPCPKAFLEILSLAKECNKSEIDTFVSFVIGYEANNIKTKTKKEYLKFVESIGLKEKQIIWREYRK